MDIGVAEIRRWHVNDNGWSDVGYHFVIRRNGLVEQGRHLDHEGAHVHGYNDVAVGVCLVGGVDEHGKAENNFTPEQLVSLLKTLRFLKAYAPDAFIQGHRDFPGVKKDCPSFGVREWLQFADPTLL
jgi:N-acetyl-anhydromuramyl-L-alanine amidase AmpD